MLLTVIRKELLEHLRSFRFIVITAVSLLLVFTSILVMYTNYQTRMENYENLHSTQNVGSVHLRPAQLSILVAGMDKSLSLQHGVNAMFINSGQSGETNVLFKLFATPDMHYIVKVILAICAVLLSFNLVSGEKEARTLALSMSNSINRTSLLLGKWFSGLAVLLAPLVVAVLAVAVFFSVSPSVQTDTQLWIKLGLLLLSSMLYLAFFFTLGLLVSCAYSRSSSALVVSLFLWALFVFIIPGLGSSVADMVVEIPSDQSRSIRQHLANIEQYVEFQKQEGAGPRPEFTEMKKQIEDYRNKLNRQVWLTNAITRISPTAVYTMLATDFAGTGTLERLNFKQTLIEQQVTMEQAAQAGGGSTPPTVSYERLSAEEVLARTGLLNLIIILLQNTVVFAAAYVLFLRYDVR